MSSGGEYAGDFFEYSNGSSLFAVNPCWHGFNESSSYDWTVYDGRVWPTNALASTYFKNTKFANGYVEVSFRMVTIPSVAYAGLYVRANGLLGASGDAIRSECRRLSGNNTLKLNKIVGGTTTQIGTYTMGTFTAGKEVGLRMNINGTTATAEAATYDAQYGFAFAIQSDVNDAGYAGLYGNGTMSNSVGWHISHFGAASPSGPTYDQFAYPDATTESDWAIVGAATAHEAIGESGSPDFGTYIEEYAKLTGLSLDGVTVEFPPIGVPVYCLTKSYLDWHMVGHVDDPSTPLTLHSVYADIDTGTYGSDGQIQTTSANNNVERNVQQAIFPFYSGGDVQKLGVKVRMTLDRVPV